MKQRNALSIQRDVLFAIFLRDLKARFSGFALGTVWLFLEPMLLITVFMLLLGARGMGELGYAEPPVFLLSGIVAFRQLWMPTQKTVANVPRVFAPYRMFRQIKIFDVMLANALVALGLFFVVTIALTVGLWWLGFNSWPNDPIQVFGAVTIAWLWSLGVGMILAIAKVASRELDKLIDILQFPLLLLSAVIYPMTVVPEQYHSLFALNPLVHMSEWMREAWIDQYVSPVLDIPFFMGCMGAALLLGMMGYRLTHKTVLVR